MSVVVSSVSKQYGEQLALNNVNFEIKTGEILGFLGPNGAGKSTMMKIITTYLPQTAGNVSVCGFDVNTSPLEVRQRVGYLPEHNPLYLDMYVREYLHFVAGVTCAPKQRVEEMIAKTGLTPESHKLIGQLSKGYRQRVGLAQAMLHDPEVLILDEPTSGLDPNQLLDIRALIREIGKEKTVMLSTHIMQEVEALCDRVIIINKGQIVADKPIGEMTSGSKTTAVTRVIFDKPLKESLLSAIEGVVNVRKFDRSGYLLEVAAGSNIQKQLFTLAVSKDLVILEVGQENRNLETVFHELTQR
jgi:ABC-2 type transport system ATP-binding protein